MEKVNAEVNKKGGLRDDLDNLLKNLIDRGTAAAKDFGVSWFYTYMRVSTWY